MTMPVPGYRRSAVRITFDEGTPTIPAYVHETEDWNGFAIVLFEREDLIAHADALRAMFVDDYPVPDEGIRLTFDADGFPSIVEAEYPEAGDIVRPVEIGGRTLAKDDWVLLPFPAANRDPEFFDRADEVVLDRERNRHAAFGLGIHRCLGSNLARMELRVALEEWMRRVPDFELADPAGVRWSTGQVRGPRALPLRLLEVAS